MSQADITFILFSLFAITTTVCVVNDALHRQKFREAMQANKDALARGDNWMKIAQAKQKEIWTVIRDNGFLHKEVIGVSAIVNRKNQERDDLIFKIWGSRTIHRNLSDVSILVEQLRGRIGTPEINNKGLANLAERHNREITVLQAEGKSARAMAEKWMSRAQENAEMLMAVINNGCILSGEIERSEHGPWEVWQDAIPICKGPTPEAAIRAAMQTLEVAAK